MHTKRFVEAASVFTLSQLLMVVGSAVALVGAGLSLAHLPYFAAVYRQYHDDSVWYSAIAQTGYIPQDTPFYPLYPALVRVLHMVFGLPIVTAGIVLASGLMVLDIALALSLYRSVLGGSTGWLAGLLWIAFPMSVFLPSMYTESLFMFGMFGALLFVRQKRFWLASLFAAVATLTRNTGVLLLIPFAWALWEDWRDSRRISWRIVFAASSIPGSIVAYFAYLWIRFGNPLIWDTMEALWGRHPMFPLYTLYKGIASLPTLWGRVGVYGHMYYVLQYGSVLLALASLPTVYRHLPRPWFWLLVAQILIPLSDPGTGIQTITGTPRHILDYFFSFDRFSLTFVPMFAALAIRVSHWRTPKTLLLGLYGAGTVMASTALTLHMFIG